ncbi:MAG: NUDIX hydrolase [Pseudomonadota bacterium]
MRYADRADASGGSTLGKMISEEVDWSAPHDGAKVALFLGDQIISILRDDIPTIPYPGLWDLPGGARGHGEGPFETVAREVQEELGLVLPEAAVHWQSAFPANSAPGKWVAFFVARLPAAVVDDIIFGDEGQRWALFDLPTFLALPDRVPSYGARLTKWQAETGGFVA